MDRSTQLSRDGILLVSLGYSQGAFMKKETSFVQLGLLYLATVLKKNNYRANLLFSDYPDISLIIEKIKSEKVVIVGFYTTTENIFRSIKCSNVLKKSCPDLIIIMGGPHASVMDEEILEKETSVDVIVRKEGENILPELVRFYIEATGDLKDIKGITYRDGNRVIRNFDGPFIEDLDTLPLPDRDLLDEPIKTFDIQFPRIITGRGCPFQCAFCHQGMGGNRYRMRSAENVLEEVDCLLKRGPVKYIRFLDDTFMVNIRRTMKLCRGLRERSGEGKNFMWFAEGRVDILSQYPRLIYEMSLAGLANIQLGVECAHQATLDIYNKKITLEQIEEVVLLCGDAKIPCISINFILGGPFETREIYEKNLKFAEKLMKIAPGRVNIISSLLVPFPGTAIRKEPDKFGLKIIDGDCITGMTNETCFCETEDLDRYELANMKMDFAKQTREIMIRNSREIPFETVSQNFSLKFYGIETSWYNILSEDTGIKRYFNLKLHRSNLSMEEISEENFPSFYPTRTYPLNYNENNLLILEKTYGSEIFNSFDTRLYELSSGKRMVKDIVNKIKEEFFEVLPVDEVYKRVKTSYRGMEKLQSIVFAKI